MRISRAASLLLPALLSCVISYGGTPGGSRLDVRNLERIDSVIYDAISQDIIPGAVVAVVHGGETAFIRAYGNSEVYPDTVAMSTRTVFDLASLSKCFGTTIAILQLAEKGYIRLSDRVDYYIPDFQNWRDPVTRERDVITIQDLLTHSSGIESYIRKPHEWGAKYGYNNPDALLSYISTEAPRNFKPGSSALYSCLNFILLQRILEGVTGERLCDYLQKNVFNPLGLESTCYFPLYGEAPSCPHEARIKALCAPTEYLPEGHPLLEASLVTAGVGADTNGGHLLRAEVHDPTARLFSNGNSGNAGMFSSAEDLAKLCEVLLNGGKVDGVRILSPLSVERIFGIPSDNDPSVARTIGWDSYYLSPGTSGDLFPRSTTIGHTGYTGTSAILDRSTGTAVIILSNRVHPTDTGSIVRMRGLIANIVAASLE